MRFLPSLLLLIAALPSQAAAQPAGGSLLAPRALEAVPPPLPSGANAIPPSMPLAPPLASPLAIPLASPPARAPIVATPLDPPAAHLVATPRNPPASRVPQPAFAGRLPTPDLPTDAAPGDFLRAAQSALAAGRAQEARQALEMAETRLLDRSVEAGKERDPSSDRAVRLIVEAIDALTAGDRMAALHAIDRASATIAQGSN